MVKAKDFLKFLCEELNYRFFTGMPKNDFVKLRKKMTSDILNYIPSVNDESAFGMAYGSRVGGTKSIVMISHDELIKCFNYVRNFSTDYGIPILILTDKILDLPKIKSIVLTDDFQKELTKFDKEIEKARLPGFVCLKGGFLSWD